MLAQELPAGTGFDDPLKDTRWEATPQQRFERLLKESEHPIGLLFNGGALRLVYAPRGESSAISPSRWSRWPRWRAGRCSVPCGCGCWGWAVCVAGEAQHAAGGSDQRLSVRQAASRKVQNGGEHALGRAGAGGVVGAAAGFDQTERITQEAGCSVLSDLPGSTEDEGLMPADSLYGQHYSIRGLADCLCG